MGLNLGLIITMGAVSFGSSIVGKVLAKTGKVTEAQLVDLASLGMLGATAVGCVVEVLKSLQLLNV